MPGQQPATWEAFVYLHNTVAMPLMKRTADLGKAYRHLSKANSMHIRLYSIASGEALYNMACCLSLGAAAAAAVAGAEDVAPGLPPAPAECSTGQELVDARLDRSVKMLEAAIEMGYTDVANLATDADLAATRERRPTHFAAALGRARLLAASRCLGKGGLTSPCSRTVSQASPPVMWARA